MRRVLVSLLTVPFLCAAAVAAPPKSPHNVLLTTRGMVKLIDFGLAFAPDRAQETTDPGIVKGKIILRKVVQRDAPSSIAASSSSRGMPRM